MTESWYREPDYSLPRRIQNHDFGKAASTLWLAPFHFQYTLWQAWMTALLGATPPRDERGVVVPISQFSSYYRRGDDAL